MSGGTSQMVYQYIAFNENGEIVKGKLSAVSEETAIELLGYAGYLPFGLECTICGTLLARVLLRAGVYRRTDVTEA